MKEILILAMFFLHIMCRAQGFYGMINEALNHAYEEAVKYDKKTCTYKGLLKVQFDDTFLPFKYTLNGIQWQKKCKKKFKKGIVYIGGYNVILGKDSMIVLASRKNYYGGPYTSVRLYWRKDGFINSVTNRFSYLLYVYNGKKWEKSNLPTKLFIRWVLKEWEETRGDIQDCIDFALNKSIENQLVYWISSIDRILVFDNTFGSDFFYRKYRKKAFPYLIATECNMKKKEIEKYSYIYGWCEILLKGNTFSIILRQVDGMDYIKKGLEEATVCKYIYDFSYSDLKNKWVCTNRRVIDYMRNTVIDESY